MAETELSWGKKKKKTTAKTRTCRKVRVSGSGRRDELKDLSELAFGTAARRRASLCVDEDFGVPSRHHALVEAPRLKDAIGERLYHPYIILLYSDQDSVIKIIQNL